MFSVAVAFNVAGIALVVMAIWEGFTGRIIAATMLGGAALMVAILREWF